MSFIQNVSDQEIATDLQEFLKTAPGIYMPGISIDAVVFSFQKGKLRVLLLRFGNTPFYILPSGYIQKEENIDDAALRNLQERTGLKNIYLEQFYTTGNVTRQKENVVQAAFQQLLSELPKDNWLEQRFVSVCYYALVDETKVNIQSDLFISEWKWFDVKKLPKVLYDHKAIIQKAVLRLQADLDQKLVAFNLLNETFTMGELQKLYEAVFQKEFTRTNFQRKMLSLDILERLEKQYNGKAHKAPYLYRFKK